MVPYHREWGWNHTYQSSTSWPVPFLCWSFLSISNALISMLLLSNYGMVTSLLLWCLHIPLWSLSIVMELAICYRNIYWWLCQSDLWRIWMSALFNKSIMKHYLWNLNLYNWSLNIIYLWNFCIHSILAISILFSFFISLSRLA